MATKGIGGYAMNRPERPEEFSSEFKRELLDIDPESLIKSKKKKKRRDDSSSSSNSDSSSSDSDSSSDHKKSKRRRRRRRRGDDRKRSGKGRQRIRSIEKDIERRRRQSAATSEGLNGSLKRSSADHDSDTSYKSPSDLEQDSDLESNGLDVKHEINPLIYSLKEDREKFNKQIFKIIRGRRRRHLMPKVLRQLPDKELKQTCLTELARWSNKRCRILMRTGKLLESEDEEAITKVPDIEQLLETGETVVTAAAEKIKEEEKKKENVANSSDEEDIEQMKENLNKWRENKLKEEMEKLKVKQEKELEDYRKECEREQQMLERELEEKRLAKQKIAELSEKLQAVSKELAVQEGLVVVEKMTLKKEKKKEPEPEPEEDGDLTDLEVDDEGNPIMKFPAPENDVNKQTEVQSEANTSLDMKDNDLTSDSDKTVHSNNPDLAPAGTNVDDIPLASSPSRQKQMPSLYQSSAKEKKKKEKKEAKKKKSKKDKDSPEEEKRLLPNLCPNNPPLQSKKDRRNLVKQWLANIGRDGPALPVPEENYYPDYADPNAKEAMEEIEAIQEAYEIDRAKKGRTDGKTVVKLKGDEIFDDDDEFNPSNQQNNNGKLEFDEIDPNDKNAVAKRMLQTMLKRQHKKSEQEPPQPDYKRMKDDTNYTNVKKEASNQPDAAGVVYSRSGSGSGSLKFSKDVKKEATTGLGSAVLSKVKSESNGSPMSGAARALAEKNKIESRNPEHNKRNKMAKLEEQMRARAIKAMMERQQAKKVKKEKVKEKEEKHAGEFPWQDDYDDEGF